MEWTEQNLDNSIKLEIVEYEENLEFELQALTDGHVVVVKSRVVGESMAGADADADRQVIGHQSLNQQLANSRENEYRQANTDADDAQQIKGSHHRGATATDSRDENCQVDNSVEETISGDHSKEAEKDYVPDDPCNDISRNQQPTATTTTSPLPTPTPSLPRSNANEKDKKRPRRSNPRRKASSTPIPDFLLNSSSDEDFDCDGNDDSASVHLRQPLGTFKCLFCNGFHKKYMNLWTFIQHEDPASKGDRKKCQRDRGFCGKPQQDDERGPPLSPNINCADESVDVEGVTVVVGLD